jgi:Zn-dependent protease
VCERCHTLVHSAELERLAAEAKALEDNRETGQARQRWLAALPLLPPTSKQADWIKSHIRALDQSGFAPATDGQRQDAQLQAGPRDNQWARQVQPASGTAATIATPQTTPFRWMSVLSFLAFVGIYSAASGTKFGVGFAVLILIHEMGHFIDIKRRGLPADMPVFLPGLGAYVRWQAMGVSLETRAAVSLAGPLAGFFASVACAVLSWQTGNPLWAGLARSGAILNLLNLIPVWVLDGGQAVTALSKMERIVLLVASAALGLALEERFFFLVALGAGYQAFFAGNLPARPSRAITIYFLAVLIALGVIIRLMPGTGLGVN